MKQRLRDLEARELWIEARVDELMGENTYFTKFLLDFHTEPQLRELCRQQATREHASLMTDLEETIIDSMELK